ncbi:phytoene desaturase family protein [Draconibacterium halophilum]|uniref:Phytoene desaturase n=1 Tax=Draconibacterium halophilum TaxID=2706887 RepID=A0A6C0RHL6_9BACT|nr:phytoene desaturase family protein [Draconibacterium halophilum]QIA09023.1 phytoene desaturase [Draconibacterium halophilum]
MKRKVLIVGAGIGGLATAIRLVKNGYDVEIMEKNEQAGGRLNQIKKDGFTFDTGPSFFSMSYEFEEFAKECGIQLPFEYVELDPLYTVNFRGDDKTYFLYKDIDKLAEQFADIEPDFKEKFERYMEKSGALFHDTVDIVIKQNFDSLAGYVWALMRVNPVHIPVLFKSFWKHVTQYFSSSKAQQIISLVAFFLGRTPFDTMGIYSLLSYTEFRHDGYYNVKGGMYKIIEGFVDVLNKEKVKIHYNTEIKGFEEKNGTLKSLTDQNGKSWSADSYLINSDAAWFRGNIFKRSSYALKKLDKMSWTMGYLTFYIGLKRKLPQVNHHNYYLGTNYKDYAENVIKNPGTLQKPYYYVNVLSKHNNECAPEGCESLFFVCPVPNLYFKQDWSDKDEIVDSILEDFSKRIGQNIKDEIVSRTIYTPEEWQNRFNLHRGSGLGLSHNMNQIGIMRPRNVDEKFKSVFYVGASTVPGAGIPMAIISSKLAFKRIQQHVS